MCWFPREVGSVCDKCTEGRVLLQYASNSSSPRPCAPSGHWSPREAEGKIIIITIILNLGLSHSLPCHWWESVTKQLLKFCKSVMKHYRRKIFFFLFFRLLLLRVNWNHFPDCKNLLWQSGKVKAQFNLKTNIQYLFTVYYKATYLWFAFCWFCESSTYKNLTDSTLRHAYDSLVHDTWSVGQHGRIIEFSSQWMVVYGTTIP